jgi:DNA-binding HxlR family transcriptional regulator
VKTCFVIQRFDGGVYDKRYRETFAPAIEKGGAKPVRADEVLGTRPVVQKIEEGLRSADIAFAEVSEDNPNVFLELGYALALGIPTLIACDRKKRSTLPFDIAHRPVSFYSTDAQSDYEKIGREVESGVRAALIEARSLRPSSMTATRPVENDDVKNACLLAILNEGLRSPGGASLWTLEKEVSSAGVSERMLSLALVSLIADGLIEKDVVYEPNDESFVSYQLSEAGTAHVLRSYSVLMEQEKTRLRPSRVEHKRLDDIPF